MICNCMCHKSLKKSTFKQKKKNESLKIFKHSLVLVY